MKTDHCRFTSALLALLLLLAPSLARARMYNGNTGRFMTMDTYEGQNEDPLSLHKYLYCGANPVNASDPSGHDIIEEIATTSIQSFLFSIALAPVAQYAGEKAAVALLPQSVKTGFNSAVFPDAIEAGGYLSVNIPAGEFPFGFTGGGGVELLISPKTQGAALYGYAAAGVSFGPNTKSASVQGTLGCVFNTPDSKHYTEYFTTLSVPYKALPVNWRTKIDGWLESGAIANTFAHSGGSEAVEEAKEAGIGFSAVLDRSAINIFFDTKGGGSWGFSFGFGLTTANASDNPSITESYYWQLLPRGDFAVPFR